MLLSYATLSRVQRRVYDNAYAQAEVAYTREQALPDDVAWTIVTGLFDGDRRRRMPKAQRMPDARGLVMLGELVEVHVADPEGNLLRHQWPGRHPACLWSHDLQAVVSWPNLDLPTEGGLDPQLMPELVEVYETWHAGRKPRGLHTVRLPTPLLPAAEVAVATLYRSDKFDRKGQLVPYIHHHDPGGVLARCSDRGVLVQGGKLKLTRGGLVH